MTSDKVWHMDGIISSSSFYLYFYLLQNHQILVHKIYTSTLSWINLCFEIQNWEKRQDQTKRTTLEFTSMVISLLVLAFMNFDNPFFYAYEFKTKTPVDLAFIWCYRVSVGWMWLTQVEKKSFEKLCELFQSLEWSIDSMSCSL